MSVLCRTWSLCSVDRHLHILVSTAASDAQSTVQLSVFIEEVPTQQSQKLKLYGAGGGRGAGAAGGLQAT